MDSVNVGSGNLAFDMPLLATDGVNGVNIAVGLKYSSNVQRQVTLWNEDAPTSVAGLGWNIVRQRILRVPARTGIVDDDNVSIDLSGDMTNLSLIHRRKLQDGTVEYEYKATN